MPEFKTLPETVPPMVTFEPDGFTIHWQEMTQREVYVAMGRVVIISHAENWSLFDVWSNYHPPTVRFSAVSDEGLRELPP